MATVQEKLQSIITKANATTGKTDADVTTATQSLVDGFGAGEDLDAVIADQTTKLAELEAAVEGKAAGGADHTVEDGLITRAWDGGDYTNDRVTEIGDGAFWHFGENTTKPFIINLPNVVNLPEFSVFSHCGASKILLPKAKYLGQSANFSSCPNLETVDFPMITDGSDGVTNMFYDCQILRECILRNITNVRFEYGSFMSCPKLEKVDLGSYKTTEHGTASNFYGDFSLKAVIIRQETVPDISGPDYENVPEFGPTVVNGGIGFVYLRKSLVAEAKAKTNWVLFADQIRAIEDYPEITGGVV